MWFHASRLAGEKKKAKFFRRGNRDIKISNCEIYRFIWTTKKISSLLHADHFHRKINFPKHNHLCTALIGLTGFKSCFTFRALLIFLILPESKFGDFSKITRSLGIFSNAASTSYTEAICTYIKAGRAKGYKLSAPVATTRQLMYTPRRVLHTRSSSQRESIHLYCTIARSEDRLGNLFAKKKEENCVVYRVFFNDTLPASDCKRKCWLHLI